MVTLHYNIVLLTPYTSDTSGELGKKRKYRKNEDNGYSLMIHSLHLKELDFVT